MKLGVCQPPGTAFRDDLTIIIKIVIETKCPLQKLEAAINWTSMKMKPSLSRSLVIRIGKIKSISVKN